MSAHARMRGARRFRLPTERHGGWMADLPMSPNPAPAEAAFDPACPAIRVLMMPRDTNAHGTIFGGVILSYIDQAGAIEARRQGCRLMLTVSMDKIVFHEPVHVGDLVSFWTETLRIGTTSITTKVTVEAIREGGT